jgi:hypothetical protein
MNAEELIEMLSHEDPGTHWIGYVDQRDFFAPAKVFQKLGVSHLSTSFDTDKKITWTNISNLPEGFIEAYKLWEQLNPDNKQNT